MTSLWAAKGRTDPSSESRIALASKTIRDGSLGPDIKMIRLTPAALSREKGERKAAHPEPQLQTRLPIRL